jgi:putative transposase
MPQHLMQRGNNRQTCFRTEADFIAYALWLGEAATRYEVQIHAWVFMTNHAHLLVTPNSPEGIPRMMQQLGRRYVRYFNEAYERTGTLWEGRYKSCLVESESYLLHCYRYIELNPVRAAMVGDPANYKWSSYGCNGLGMKSKLLTPHQQYLALGSTERERLENYRSLFHHPNDGDRFNEIRASMNSGIALKEKPGSESTLTPGLPGLQSRL